MLLNAFNFSFVNNNIFFFKINYIFKCSLKELQTFFKQYFPQYKVCLFSIWSNTQIVGIEWTQGLYSLDFAVESFSALFAQSSIFLLEIQYQDK